MTFLYPDVLYLLILPALLAVVACILWKRRSKRWEVLIAPAYKNVLVQAPATWHRTLPIVFGILAAIFSILSMARPFDGYSEREEMPKSRNILIAIDCSRSMLCKDVSPSRLERAKTATYDLLDALPADNFGIIIFSGNAVLLMPLTYDHEALKETIEQLKFGWVSQGGSNLDSAVSLALRTFKRDKKPDAMDALVILSDGEDTVNVSPKIAAEAKQNNLILITAGIGTTSGTTIPDEKHPTGLYHDYEGNTIVSKLNPDNLQNLASMTNGQYVQLSNGASLNAFVKETASKLEANQNDSVKTRIPNDRYYIFAIPALVCLLLTLIASTKWRSIKHIFKSKSVSSLFIFTSLLFCLAASPAHATDDSTQNIIELIRNNQADEAIKAIDAALLNPSLSDDKRHALNYAKGFMAKSSNQNQLTAEALSEALLSSSTQLQSDVHCHLGNLSGDAVKQKMSFKQKNNSASPQLPQSLSIDEKIKEIDRRLKAINESKIHLKEAFSHFDDAISTTPTHKEAHSNKEKLSDYAKKLDEYKKNLEKLKKQLEEEKKKQQQQQQQQNNKNQQNQEQSDSKDKQDKSDNNNKQDNKKSSDKNQQNQDDKKDKDNKKDADKDKDKNNEKNKQDKDKDKADKDNQKSNEKDEQKQDKQKNTPSKDDEMKNARPEEKNDNEKERPKKAPDNQEAPQKQEPLSITPQKQAQSDKELQEARDILKERRDQEEGCFVPQPIQIIPPKKDY